MPMTSQQLKATTLKNVRVVPVEPQVKSAETCELPLRGMSAEAGSAKTADPSCYSSPVGAGETARHGLFENRRWKMERVVAIKTLGKLLGKSLGYRVDPKAPTSEEREGAQRQLPALTAAKQEASKAMEDRRRALLDGDQQYQELVAAYRIAREKSEKMFSILHHFKFTVGTSNGMFFHIKAQGDSWEEVIGKLTKAA